MIMAEEPAVDSDPWEPTEDEIKTAAAAVIAKADETLDEREQLIVRGRFGIDGTATEKRSMCSGSNSGLSKERVRQLLQGSEKLGEAAKPFESTFAPR